jgi:hypothetical protein
MKPIMTVGKNIAVRVGKTRHKQKVWIILVIWLITSTIAPTSYGTTIIVFKQKGEIWIAADSLQFGQSSDGKTATRNTCKIFKKDSFYWAASGDVVEDDVSGFSLSRLMSKILDDGKSIDQIASDFIVKAEQPILGELYSLKKLDPEMYADLGPVASFLFFELIILRVEKGTPDVRFLAFYGHIDHGRFSIVHVGPEGLRADADSGGIGIKKEALTYIAAHRVQSATNPIAVLSDSISQEASLHPHFVGLPVSILQLTSGGFVWKEKGRCQ